MEGNSDTESSQIMGDWSIPPVDPEGIVMYSVPDSSDEGSKVDVEKDESLLPAESTDELDKAKAKDKAPILECVAGGSSSGKEKTAKRVAPPWMDPSYEWGGGKWKIDGRTNRKNTNEKNKKKKENEEKREVIPFREIIRAILRNSDIVSMAALPNCSDLPEDVIRLILERLSYVDFHRARVVCSDWYRVYGECIPKRNQIPWRMFSPHQAKLKRSCVMYNPQGENTISKVQDLGVDPCLANCGNWLLMSDPRSNLYLLNLLNLKRIKLPAIEYQRGQLLLERKGGNRFSSEFCHSSQYTERMEETNGFKIRKAVFWIYAETEDYAVAWSWGLNGYIAFTKEGHSIWRQISPFVVSVDDLVYRNNKLYAYTKDSRIRITDFSSRLPTHVYINPPEELSPSVVGKTNIAVTISGDVLVVVSTEWDNRWRCKLYKYDSTSNDWNQNFSLGDEALILDRGTTVVASNVRGIDKNSIYFSVETNVLVYDLTTKVPRKLSSSEISDIPFWGFSTS